MDKLSKAVESICEDCQLGIKLENCKQCLFNLLNGRKKSEYEKTATHTK